jgi:hypothetical protein
LSKNDPLPDLKETAEDLADEFRIDIRKIEEITKYCLEQGLLEYSTIYKKIVSLKIAELIDDYTGRKKQVVEMIDKMKTEIKNSGVTTNKPRMNNEHTSNNVPSEEKRTDQKRTKQKKEISCVLDFYNSHCLSLPKVLKLTQKREGHINALLKVYSLEEIKLGFIQAEASDFIAGRSGKWKASFDWLINKNNFLKVIEGNYGNSKKKKMAADINISQADWDGVKLL